MWNNSRNDEGLGKLYMQILQMNAIKMSEIPCVSVFDCRIEALIT